MRVILVQPQIFNKITQISGEQSELFEQFFEELKVLNQLSDVLTQLGSDLKSGSQELANKLGGLSTNRENNP
ncbi:hypothetical protein [Moraxella porci]|uniref:hypothetical protein n=1 Tax=Moraxella porci TaxID=1288392 RepID=UPI00244CA3EA|nr:hypothetical protein [Moraxella porci]MDH2274331.1 hypothetical protein [Moraxella porci]